MTAVAPGRRVRLHWTLAIEGGPVVDTTEDDEPVELTLGDGTLHERFEAVLEGLEAGARAVFYLQGSEVFGSYDPEAVHTMERAEFPPDMTLEPGHVVGFTTPGGDEIAGTVLAVDDDAVKMDFNHPLANRDLSFKVQILEVW